MTATNTNTNTNIITRGEVDLTKAIAICDEAGNLKAFKTKIPLSIQDGTLVKPVGMGVTLCSAEGYKMQQRYSGLIADMLPTVVVDGKEQGNPYVGRDGKGRIQMVYCRAFCFGYTEMGVRSVVSKTVVFDVHTYELVDLIAKAKSQPADFQLRPIDMESPGAKWAKYPIDDSTAIFANVASDDFLKWMGQIMNRKRKAVEIAQTFAIRNAIKSHPMVKFHKLDGGEASTIVPALCHYAAKGEMRWDRSQYAGFVDNVQALLSGKSKVIDAEVIDGGTDAIHEDPSLVDAEAYNLADTDDIPEDVDDGQQREAKSLDGIRSDFDLMTAMDPDVLRRARKKAKVEVGTSLADMTDTELLDTYAAVQEISKKEGEAK